jgi:hypothetical protein
VTALSVQRFLAALDARLAGLDADGLRAGLGRYGTALPSAQREAFLAGLAAVFPGPAATAGGVEKPADPAQDPALLGDIDAFIEALEAGEYVVDDDDYDDRYGYDEYEPENSEAVAEVAGLLAAVDRVFLAGGLELAREAYGRLFQALRGSEDSGLSGIDLGESAERYLRAIYECFDDPVERAAELTEAWLFDIPDLRPPRSMAAVREALPADLRDFDAFAPHWTAELTARSLEADRGYVGATVLRALLTEAALASAGTDGLAQVARAGGSGQADAFTAWIDALRVAGRFDEALDACREALDAAPKETSDTQDWRILSAQMIEWSRWSAVADRAAALAQHRGDAPAWVGFCEQAWDLAPTTRRLCALFVAAERPEPGGGPRAVDRLVQAMPADRSRGRGIGAANAGDLSAQALLLAGRLDTAVELLSAKPEGYADPGATLLPYLLAAGAGRAATVHAKWTSTVLFGLVSGIGRDRYADLNVFHHLEDETDRDAGAVTVPVGTDPESAELGDLLVDLLSVRAAEPARSEAEKGWLVTAQAEVDRYLERIVGGQHRSSYAAAARMAAACAEALILAGDTNSYLAAARSTYPRHSAFHRELGKARSGSPLLRGRVGAPPEQKASRTAPGSRRIGLSP